MSVKVNPMSANSGGGLMSSPAFRIAEVGVGAYTGNPMMVAGGLAKPGSPAAGMAKIGGMAQGMSGSGSQAPSPSYLDQNYQMRDLGEPATPMPKTGQGSLGNYDDYFAAMKRRASQYGGY